MIYLRLYYEFFKVGLFSVGGGLATIPFLQDLGARTGWFSAADLADMIAVSESTPGPMGVNMSTYVGYTCGGVLGAVVGVLGLVTPSVLVILMIAGFLKRFRDSRVVDAVFSGLRPASTALITAAGVSVARIALFVQDDGAARTGGFYWPAVAIAGVVVVCMAVPRLKKIHPIAYIGLAALAGVIFHL